MGHSSCYIVLVLAALAVLLVQCRRPRQASETSIRNLRARYDPSSNTILVEWDASDFQEGDEFTVRYRSRNRPSDSQFRHLRTSEKSARLELADVRNEDEVEVQVKRERNGDDWSRQLIILVTKQRTQIGDILIDDDDILPPLNFAANVIGPTTVRLEWTPSNGAAPDVYYLVNVKQLTSESGESLLRQQIKVESNEFVLGDLVPGEHYEMTIRSATSPDTVSATAAIVEITLPKDAEYFEVGNLIISSRFRSDGTGVVTLQWEVPDALRDRIVAYDVQYAPSGSDFYKRLNFPGHNPIASLHELKSDTEYTLKIKTVLQGGQETESGEFRFRTPKVSTNPISKLDVIYSSETSAVQLQWTLEPHVVRSRIAGYDIYISEDKDLPEDAWQYIRADTKDPSVSLERLKTLTTYYVKINVREADGNVINSPSIYRFTTVAQLPTRREARSSDALAYRSLSPDRVLITWSYPADLVSKLSGTWIYYSDDSTQPWDEWNKISIDDASQRTATLSGLQHGTVYTVRIVPRLQNGEPDFDNVEGFELRTDMGHTPRSRRFVNENEVLPPVLKDANTRKHMRITSCNPDAFKPGCGSKEYCVQTMDDPPRGWCIPESIRQAILANPKKRQTL